MYSGYIIAFSAFLIIASRDEDREPQHSKLLLFAAIVNIISTALLYFFPSGFSYSSITTEERFLRTLLTIIPSLIIYIPNIFSFGIVFTFYGYKNRRQIGNYLMYSGLFWLVFTIWASVCIFSPYGSMPQLPFILDEIVNFPHYFIPLIISQILLVGSGFDTLANIFLLIHAFLNKDKSLKIAGLIYFIGNATFGLSFIPTYISYMIL
jgi:hypothetical protein